MADSSGPTSDPAPDALPPAAPRRRVRGWWRAAAWMALGAGVTVSLLAAAALIALQALERRPELAAGWLQEQLGREVHLREMEVAWRHGIPVLRLRGLELGGAGGIALDDTEIRVAPIASLRAGRLRPSTVTVRGAAIALDRKPDGSVTVSGLGRARSAASGTALGGAVGSALGGALAMLPRAAMFRLEEASVSFTGIARDGVAVLLAPVSLRLHQAGGTVRVDASIASAQAPAQPVRVSLRWPRAADDPLERAEFTLSARELALSSLPAAPWGDALDGLLTLDLDGAIAAGRLQTLRGSVVLAGPRLATRAATLGAVESIDSLVEFRRGRDGWWVDLLRLQARSRGHAWPPTSARLEYRAGAPEAPWQLEFAGAPLAELLPVLRDLPLTEPTARALLAAATPRGRVEDAAIHLDADFTRARVESLHLRDVGLRSADGRIVVGPVNAALSLANGGGRLALEPSPVRVRPPQDATPLEFTLGGVLAWQPDAAGVALSSTGMLIADGDARLEIDGRVHLPARADEAVALDLEARGDLLEMDTLRPYLALPGLPSKLRAWLGVAFEGGALRRLTARIAGDARTPADAAVLVDAHARIDAVTLRFQPEWPPLDTLSGELTLSEGALGVTLDDGRVNGAHIEKATGGIADVTAAEPVIALSAQVSGSTAQATGFITASPLGRRFPGLLPLLDARGRAHVNVRLEIPIGPTHARLAGNIRLEDNTLGVPGLRSPLSRVEGSIGFDRDGMGAGTLEATYLGRRIEADLDGAVDGHQRTRLTIRGRTDPDGLLRHLYDVGAIASDDRGALPLLSRLDGETAWQVVMDIPNREELQREGISLTVSSDLDGMALRLPAPMDKARAGSQPLRVRTRLAQAGARVFHVDFGGDIRAVMRAKASAADAESFTFDRGELRFGGAPATLPADPGLNVTGTVQTVSVDDWVAFIALAAGGGGDGEPTRANALATVNAVTITAERLDVLGAAFDRVDLNASREPPGAWRIAVRGEGLDGTIEVPWPIGAAPIDARFKHIDVRREAGTAEKPNVDLALAPGDLPPARLVAQKLSYNGVDLGVAKLTLTRGPEGLLVEELVSIGETFEVRGSGSWSRSGGQTDSQLDLRMHSGDFGALTAALGYADSGVEGGVAEIVLRARWQGSPFDLALERISGTLSFQAGGGWLREVDPGTTGRMFGLLNVTQLPRRLLRLDFSDLFEEGVAYESLTGSFRLHGGHAYTDDVEMQTQNARIQLVGRVGLVDEDYEQVMTVTPKLSTSLPLVPLWLAEKFLNRKLIDNAFAYRYIITGPWSDPHIERERVEAVPTDAG